MLSSELRDYCWLYNLENLGICHFYKDFIMSHVFQRMNYAIMGVLLLVGMVFTNIGYAQGAKMDKVLIQTSMGDIVVKLDTAKAPISTENFIAYVNDGFYNGTLFHRVIPGFMIQGGGFSADFSQKPTKSPIKNEAANGLKNKRGTLAMARTSDPNSATGQFFINLKDNSFLDYTSATPSGYGYAVFGEVVEGMDVVDKIAQVKTGSKNGHQDVPVEPVLIKTMVLEPMTAAS
jgi:peptidyl-prolyl cis-trans isomerase B (cyclophilin B)